MKKLSLLLMMTLFGLSTAMAQRTITGTVTDDTGEALIGATVQAVGAEGLGAATDIDGVYSIDVPAGATGLLFSYTGFADQEVAIGASNVVDVVLESDAQLLDEVVVTGVGKGTSTKKLGFAVSKVGTEALEKVPGLDPGNALRGKASGVRIVQASGNPSYAPEIRLRGSTSISGSQRPLIIIDGIITDGDLRDINMDDVESMEVVKGAAASALYGSLAGNGVVQIITKNGNSDGSGARVTFKGEYGKSSLANEYPIAKTNPFAIDPMGVRNGDWDQDPSTPETSNFGFDLTGTSVITNDPDGRFDNPFPTTFYDNIDRFLGGNDFYNASMSIGNTGADYNYLLSFSNQTSGGLVDVLPDYVRNNFRANLDVRPNDKLKISFRSLYGRTDGVDVNEQGQGENLFFNLLTYEPFIDLTETDPEYGFNPIPTGIAISTTNAENPLYLADALDNGFKRDRLIAGISLNYDLFEDLSLELAYSLDRTDENSFFYRPKGFFDQSAGAVQDGNQFERRDKREKSVYSAQAQYSKDLGDINLTGTLKYLFEDESFNRTDASGSNFVANGIRNLGALENPSIGSFLSDTKSENVFLDAVVDYNDKLILGGMIRYDGSSRFGENERYQWYYRGSAAYRITEDVKINGIDEWKIRASYGTSGQRPPFTAQYETFAVSQNGTSRAILGNADLRPSNVKEFEFGTDIAFAKRFNATINYAVTNTEDDYILVPLSSVAGFSSQWQNVGNIEATAFEVELGGQLMKKKDFSWDAAIFFDKITQKITDLGGIPAFTANTATAFDLFRVEEGLPYGTMYGNQILGAVSDLSVNDAGIVLNAIQGGNPLQAEGMTVNDFYVNNDGYVVPMTAATDDMGNVIMTTDVNGDGVYDPASGDVAQRVQSEGTTFEQAMYLADAEGTKSVTSIGNTNPNFNIGLSTTFNYKGLSLYVLVDHQNGGDIYNYTKQLLYFNDRHGDLADNGARGKHVNYSNGASALYNVASASSHFVEDGTFTKIREVSLAYKMNKKQLGNLGKHVHSMKFQLSGRNLFTFTDYTGFDPEVAIRNNATNFRFDEYSYPNYRTFTGSIIVEF